MTRIRHYPFKKLTDQKVGTRTILNKGNCKIRKLYRARFSNRLIRENPEKYLWLRNLDAKWAPFR